MKVKIENQTTYNLKSSKISNDIIKAFGDAMFDQRENEENTLLYHHELLFLECVRNGDLEQLKNLLQTNAEPSFFMGCMSKNPLRHAQYAFVSAITLITRSAIEGGMPEMDAYNLSDVYIQRLDLILDFQDISTLFMTAVYDFINRVSNYNSTRKMYSSKILQ